MGIFTAIVSIISGAMVIIGFLSMIIKPIREKILTNSEKDTLYAAGMQCLLRSEILSIYYNNQDTKILRQYERENLESLYSAYKALGGNSFIQDLYTEMKKWQIRT